jgi:hypothetical protein
MVSKRNRHAKPAPQLQHPVSEIIPDDYEGLFSLLGGLEPGEGVRIGNNGTPIAFRHRAHIYRRLRPLGLSRDIPANVLEF